MSVRINRSKLRLGKRIQNFRKEQQLTQEDLAEKLDISRTHMGHIEQGRKSPSLKLLEKIAKTLKVKTNQLL